MTNYKTHTAPTAAQVAQFAANHPNVANATFTHTPPTTAQIAQFEANHSQIELTGIHQHVPAVSTIA